MPCGKNKYESRKLAKQAMNRRNRQIKPGERRVMNIYWCTPCDGWHMTSMTKNKYERLKNENDAT